MLDRSLEHVGRSDPEELWAARINPVFRPTSLRAGGYVGTGVADASFMRLPTLVLSPMRCPVYQSAAGVCRQGRGFVSRAMPYFRGKADVTGNPVRREFFEIPARQRDASRFHTGVWRSQGAPR